MTLKSRRKPPHALLSPSLLLSPRLVVPLGLGAALALSIAGFIYFTKITLEIQAHFAPEAAHPWDGYAALSLFCGLVSGAGLLLSLHGPPPMRWRRSRTPRSLSSRRLSSTASRQAKRRQGSGTMGRQ